jgi:hypothetical protein
MSFREKTAWISLVSMAGIYAAYFWSLYHSGVRHIGLLETVIALVVAQVILTTLVAIFAPKEAKAPRDEREKQIDLKATRLAYFVLAGSVACACFFRGFPRPIIFDANAFLFFLVVAEILRSGCQIVQYRRGN